MSSHDNWSSRHSREVIERQGLSRDQIFDSVEILVDRNLVDATKVLGPERYALLAWTVEGMEAHLRATEDDYPAHLEAASRYIASQETPFQPNGLAPIVGDNPLVEEHVLRLLESVGDIRRSPDKGHAHVMKVSVDFRRTHS